MAHAARAARDRRRSPPRRATAAPWWCSTRAMAASTPARSASQQTIEKDVVWPSRGELKAKLEATGQVRVVMTRDSDVFISLGERVRMAQAQQREPVRLDPRRYADGEPRGARTDRLHQLRPRLGRRIGPRSPKRKTAPTALAGIELPEDDRGGRRHSRRPDAARDAHLFAPVRPDAGRADQAASKLNKNPHRSAGFRVLRAPDVPSVLVELGYLSSKIGRRTAQARRHGAKRRRIRSRPRC